MKYVLEHKDEEKRKVKAFIAPEIGRHLGLDRMVEEYSGLYKTLAKK
jgi:hypothetical protein